MNKTILVVDDDEVIRKLIIRILQKEGYKVLVAKNGKEGLTVYKKSTVDLIITDIIMPDMEGIEFILSLKKLNGQLPIIAISGGGYLSPHDYLETADDFGVDYTISKPFEPKNLIEKVNILLNPVEN